MSDQNLKDLLKLQGHLVEKHGLSWQDIISWDGPENVATMRGFWKLQHREFHFDHDPCPLNPNGLRSTDGLGDWGRSNFVNPPYSNKEPWIKKACLEREKGNLTVMLLPVDTSTAWFHDYILPNCEIRWLRGRLTFHARGSPAKFASMLCIFRPKSLILRET